MVAPLLKYFSDRGGPESEHHGNLHWPGTAAGVPLRGEIAPLLRGDEYESQITHTADFHSRLFQLWSPEDKRVFDIVMERIHAGWYQQMLRYDRWCDEHCGLLVWLEWRQIYGEALNGKSPTSLG